MTTINTISSEQTQQILQTIAASNPDYPTWVAEFTANAFISKQLPADLSQDVLAVLAENPQQAIAIEALSKNPNATKNFTTGAEVATFMAVAFLFRTHIKIKRNTNSKWEFLIENKPSDSKLLGAALKKLEDWLDSSDN